MKELWAELDPSLDQREKEQFLKGVSSLCDVIIAKSSDLELVRKVGKRVASERDGDILLLDAVDEDLIRKVKGAGKQAAVRLLVKNRGDELRAIKAADMGAEYVLVTCPNWKIIPLENLIAALRGKSRILAEAGGAEEAKIALEALEVGVDGVILKSRDIREFEKSSQFIRESDSRLTISAAKVVEIRPIESGARVCVDTVDLMRHGEGLLTGSQSSALFLVQAEVLENPHVEPRPFRVNAGAVSLYVLTPGGKTKYLSELKAGDQVLIVDRSGKVRTTSVGRVKIEQRPFLLIEAEHEGRRIKTIVQNAETIRMVTRDGSKAVTDLKVGEEVLVRAEEGGRHFGTLVKDEMIIEK